MAYGVEVEGSTIKRLVDHTDVLYRLVSSYTVTATLTYSYSTNNVGWKPRFFRVALPSTDSVVTLAPLEGFGTSMRPGGAQGIAKVWRGVDAEVYLTTDARPILVAIYAPIQSVQTSTPGYGLQIISQSGNTFSSADELLFPIGVGSPSTIKGRNYTVPVSVAMSTVGHRLSDFVSGVSFYMDISSGQICNTYFTGAFWRSATQPEGSALGISSSTTRNGIYVGATMVSPSWRDTGWRRNPNLDISNKLGMGAIMVAKSPNIPAPE